MFAAALKRGTIALGVIFIVSSIFAGIMVQQSSSTNVIAQPVSSADQACAEDYKKCRDIDHLQKVAAQSPQVLEAAAICKNRVQIELGIIFSREANLFDRVLSNSDLKNGILLLKERHINYEIEETVGKKKASQMPRYGEIICTFDLNRFEIISAPLKLNPYM